MLRSARRSANLIKLQDETFFLELAAQRYATTFFEKFDRSEIQELLAVSSTSWLAPKDDIRFPLQLPSGLIGQIKNFNFPNAIVLAPVEPDIQINYREVHQMVRELTVGIYCLNQIPSICLDANYDLSTSCQLPLAYYDTRVGQILISIDYMIKALWHGAYMPKEKRVRFSDFWRSNLDVNANGIPQTSREMFAEFGSAGLVDISQETEFAEIYSSTSNMDPTFEPDGPEEVNLFMQYVDNILLKMAYYITQVEQYDNIFTFDASYNLTNEIRLLEEQLDLVTYQRLQQRINLQRKIVTDYIEKKAEIRKNITCMKLITFLVPFFIALKKKSKIPDLSQLIPALSDDKLKTERELPPMMLGPDFKCRHFQFKSNEYFHMHGGIELDIGTPSLGDLPESIKAACNEIQEVADTCLKQLLDPEMAYRDNYPLPVMEFEGKKYYVISIHLESFYQPMNKSQWWGAINVMMDTLKPKRLPLSDIQLHDQVKKRFGYKKAIKCKNLSVGLKSAAKRGLAAVFHTFCRKTPLSGLNFMDEAGYGFMHYAALHNRVPIIAQLVNSGLSINLRRHERLATQGPTSLHLACLSGSLETLTCLLALKADYHSVDQRGWMPIHYAAFYGNINCIRALHRKEPALLEAETTAEYQSTPLLLAATSGAFDTLEYLLSIGANWKKTDSLRNNIVHLSILYFHIDVLKYLIERNFQELPAWTILVEMLQSEDITRKEMSARCMEVLCTINDNYWEHIFQAVAVPSLVKMMQGDDQKLQCLASGVLSNISNHVPISVTLVEVQAIPVLVKLLSSQKAELQSRCSLILADIAQVNDYQTAVAEMGAIPPLVNLLQVQLLDVLVNVVNCIRVLCINNPANQKEVKDQGGIPSLVAFLRVKSDVLVGTASAAIAALAHGNQETQEAIVNEDAISYLVRIICGRKINIQLKAAMAMEALADNNAHVQKKFLEKAVAKHLLKLLKVFQLEVKEQCAKTLWALAGQKVKQQKYMAEQIGYNSIVDMLLLPSDIMQYVGGQAVIALSKDSKHHQDKICEENGIAPLVRLMRSSKIAVKTLLCVIRALGTICLGVAHTNNSNSQEKIAEEGGLPTLMQLLRAHNSLQIKVETACTLACVVLMNHHLQTELLKNEGFDYTDVLELLQAPDKEVRLRGGYALALFGYNNTLQQFLIMETGGIKLSMLEPFLQSEDEGDKATAAFQIVVLARAILDMDQVALSARGITILVELLKSKNSTTLVLVGDLLASLAHTRAGIPEAITTLGAVEYLCNHLHSENDEVRVACASALGYLTFNRNAHRRLMVECRNKPKVFKVLINNLNKDAKISDEFIEEFKRHKQVGLPSVSLITSGRLSASSAECKGKYDTRFRSEVFTRSKSAVVYLKRIANPRNQVPTTILFSSPTPSIKTLSRSKTAPAWKGGAR
ncbi:ankyrin and armadillo repeat-containing protein [Microcaecilia unicolor]|uniref:Ankyrin and armadillo repeat-containing protein n=1 Tax=Microcaecilia unicolor TaxID=1415580 RepID=A0A6P7YSP4_9AMPH|nr:ankyrin and armadillo repeat-containing protein [Microcaecilia unicolor]